MKQEIVNAIAAYLENETHLSNKHGETFVQFKHPLKIGFNRAEYCDEIAQEIAAKIDPLLPKAAGWEDAPEWAEWRVTTEFMGVKKTRWHENLQVIARVREVGTQVDEKIPINWGQVVGTIERRPNDQTPSPIR